jgi:RNA polymerase sigma-70 factor, ECF subfamily
MTSDRLSEAGLPSMMPRNAGSAPDVAPVAAPAGPSRREGSGTDRTWAAAELTVGAGLDDRAIVDAVLAGDRDAFRRIVEREGGSVISVCARVLGDRVEAEDVAQETFVIAYRSLATWRADGPIGAWLARIAVRLAIRRAAQRRQVVWLDPLAADADLPNQDRYRTGGRQDGADPASSILRSERDTQLRAAVAALDEPYREVVALRFFGERSLQEIADVTHRPLGTVKTHLHRGLARLRRSMDEAER